MTSRPLLIFDFDGVIADGIAEYWWSSRRACFELLDYKSDSTTLPEDVPQIFRQIRPWVHQGWEMVLLASELIRPESALVLSGAKAFANNYQLNCKEALNARNWEPGVLQNALESVRRQAIKSNRTQWLGSYKAFPGVVQRLHQLNTEGYEFAVLTTKGSEFTAELLDHFHITPSLIYGHESGSKQDVLLQLAKTHCLKGFIEDRRKTLETMINTPELNSLTFYLASWGYLKDEDTKDLPHNIHLLDKQTFMTPLASWP
ncbi:HAD hydrolase-like protein [Prochlorococcus sp. MIT 1307]|uniref:HAD family hydrolase n=1 Tax=Prochlorococcus sp. MIT 1307 TaxID=3096219 RepID=UPI002A749374|nr:HAD hydrolase-like protein [Prochlorococcus sp. MIT 1307]